ncbi:hypothetical protein BD780_000225 [Clostridium tetanomorphum]|uniref:Uncharacterized protein n=1 Tax=Clostridium tetanomorphum TaxID=1553 RepID=A0A923E7T5_CLOTT|nr:hypothetical protein [Clostridium tetanomorphum]KAJ51103.1 hypothetical protein CTM_14493 [Clostridium tetanomorphum DSM 665]MBC2398023.1 hypothetical protein [Clostridium tetanomorphum]MBP1864469.1 hypothetical protein [Clostridium tetanomorphum]NRS83000.1 hypothetical protein [Clostridium tetanomorphum]NRZ98904.1 hypothetical protein [Clostridium tetanomorphum]
MKLTANYGLRKPDGNDAVNIEDLNYNADILDKKVKEVESNAGSVKSVNGKTGAVVLNAADIKTNSGTSVELQLADIIQQQKFYIKKFDTDENGIDTRVEKYRLNGTLLEKSVLSGGVSPNYTTRTITFYTVNGITVTDTIILTQIYFDNEWKGEKL